MSARYPHQAIALTADGKLVVSASGSSLLCFSSETNKLSGSTIGRSDGHQSFIRNIAVHSDALTGHDYVVSTAEDKSLMVWILPLFVLQSTRILNKRANALSMAPDGSIAVGDKFGDIFSYPLVAPPVAPLAKGAKAPEMVPIAGHVAMLNALVLVPAHPPFVPRDYIVSGDRDEHVRVSRWPQGYVIETFLHGSQRFIAALEYIPPTTSHPVPLILSGGGDSTIQSFNLTTSALVAKIPIGSMFYSLVVAPDAHVPLVHGKRLNHKANKIAEKARRGTGKGKNKGKGKVTTETVELDTVEIELEDEDDAEEPSLEEPAEVEQEIIVQVPAAATSDTVPPVIPASRADTRMKPDGKTKGLAIFKIVRIGDRETGGAIVLATGSTAVAFIPMAQLEGLTAPTPQPLLLDLQHPVLDICIQPGSLRAWASLDLSRGAPVVPEQCAIVQLHLEDGNLIVTDPSALAKVMAEATETISDVVVAPSVPLLYPGLTLLHNPEDFTPDEPLTANQAKRFQARPPPLEPKKFKGGNGKRAEGRAQIMQRFVDEQARQEGSATPTTTAASEEGESMQE